MNKIILIFLTLTLLSCSTDVALDNAFSISGTISNLGTSIESCTVTISNIVASENHHAYNEIGNTFYSDSLGQYNAKVACGTSWTEKVNGNKEYKVYVESIELLFQKNGFRDTTIIVTPPSLEDTYVELNILLTKL